MSVALWVLPREETSMYALYMGINGQHHDWHVSSAAQIISALGQVFSTVVSLSLYLDNWERTSSPEWHNEVDRTHWRGVLRSFNNVKTLHVQHGLLEELSRTLQLQDGESPMELLPELKELRYDAGSDISGAFVPFLDVRRHAGRPFTLVPILKPRNRRLGRPPLPPSLGAPTLVSFRILLLFVLNLTYIAHSATGACAYPCPCLCYLTLTRHLWIRAFIGLFELWSPF